MTIRSDTVIEDFGEGLAAEIDAVARNIRTEYTISRGTRINDEGPYLYRCAIKGNLHNFCDCPVTITLGGRGIDGILVSARRSLVTVAVSEDIGTELPAARLRIDPAAILRSISSGIRTLADPESARAFNFRLARRALEGRSSTVEGVPILALQLPELSPDQRHAVSAAFGQSTTYLWCPPGTGATRTLSTLAAALAKVGMRVLMVARDTERVDELLFDLCDRLTEAGDPLLEDRRILRFGVSTNDSLRDRFGEQVCLESIVAEKTALVRVAVTKLQAERAKILAEVQRQEDALSAAGDLVVLESRLEQLERSSAALRRERLRCEERIGARERNLKKFSRRLAAAERWPEIFRRLLRLHLRSLEQRSTAEARRKLLTERAGEEISELLRASEAERQKLKQCVDAMVPMVRALDQRSCAVQTRQLRLMLADLDRKIIQLTDAAEKFRPTMVGNCRIAAATHSRCVLHPKEVAEFDTVIVDQAATAILPLAFLLAGIPRKQIVYAGDFRTSMPSVYCTNEALTAFLQTDIFEAAGVRSKAAAKGQSRLVELSTQTRRREALCKITNTVFYGGQLRTTWKGAESLAARQVKWLAENPVTIFDTQLLSPRCTPRADSRVNIVHALLVRLLCTELHLRGIMGRTFEVGVVSPHRLQINLIEAMCREAGLAVPGLSTFDSPPSESELLVVDITDAFPALLDESLAPESIELSAAKCLNAVLSSARNHLVVIADLNYLDSQLRPGHLLHGIVADLRNGSMVVDGRQFLDQYSIPSASRADGAVPSGLNAQTFGKENFYPAFLADLMESRSSVLVITEEVTLQRATFFAPHFAERIANGVEVVLGIPAGSCTSSKAETELALSALSQVGVQIFTVPEVPEKVCCIDGRIVWVGLLDALSPTASGTVLRFSSVEVSTRIRRRFQDRRRSYGHIEQLVAAIAG